jgi:hypothetical protein
MRRKKSKLTKAEILNRAIAAWEQRQEGAVIMLRKSAEMLMKLRRQRLRMLKRMTVAPSEPDTAVATEPSPEPAPTPATQVESADTDDEDIPGFLQRTGKEKDEAARKEIEAEQADKKKRAAERRIKKLKIGQEIKQAELTGQRRKMPLSGKAALAAIR